MTCRVTNDVEIITTPIGIKNAEHRTPLIYSARKNMRGMQNFSTKILEIMTFFPRFLSQIFEKFVTKRWAIYLL